MILILLVKKIYNHKPPPSILGKKYFFLFDIWGLKGVLMQRIFFFWWGQWENVGRLKPTLVSGVPTPKFRGIPNFGGGPYFVGTHFPVIYSRSREIFLKFKVGNLNSLNSYL